MTISLGEAQSEPPNPCTFSDPPPVRLQAPGHHHCAPSSHWSQVPVWPQTGWMWSLPLGHQASSSPVHPHCVLILGPGDGVFSRPLTKSLPVPHWSWGHWPPPWVTSPCGDTALTVGCRGAEREAHAYDMGHAGPQEGTPSKEEKSTEYQPHTGLCRNCRFSERRGVWGASLRR